MEIKVALNSFDMDTARRRMQSGAEGSDPAQALYFALMGAIIQPAIDVAHSRSGAFTIGDGSDAFVSAAISMCDTLLLSALLHMVKTGLTSRTTGEGAIRDMHDHLARMAHRSKKIAIEAWRKDLDEGLARASAPQ